MFMMEHSVFLAEPSWFFAYAGVFIGLVVWSAPWFGLVSLLFLRKFNLPSLFALLTCPACFGFWFGALSYLLAYHGTAHPADALVTGALTAVVSALTYRLLNWLLGG